MCIFPPPPSDEIKLPMETPHVPKQVFGKEKVFRCCDLLLGCCVRHRCCSVRVIATLGALCRRKTLSGQILTESQRISNKAMTNSQGNSSVFLQGTQHCFSNWLTVNTVAPCVPMTLVVCLVCMRVDVRVGAQN